MEIELSYVFSAPIEKLWAVVLDPQRVSKCVPGMQSVEVISDTEYNARIKVKIAFISAQFTVRTVITEMNAPHYLQAEASGQDKSIGSSVKAVVGMNLTTVGEGQTELRVTSKATVLGRLGTLGLNPMRTKAERMWEEFCTALAAMLSEAGTAEVSAEASEVAALPQEAPQTPQGTATVIAKPAPPMASQTLAAPLPRSRGFFSRFRKESAAETIRIELDRNGARVVICCPASRTDQCLAWLDRQLVVQGGGK